MGLLGNKTFNEKGKTEMSKWESYYPEIDFQTGLFHLFAENEDLMKVYQEKGVVEAVKALLQQNTRNDALWARVENLCKSDEREYENIKNLGLLWEQLPDTLKTWCQGAKTSEEAEDMAVDRLQETVHEHGINKWFLGRVWGVAVPDVDDGWDTSLEDFIREEASVVVP